MQRLGLTLLALVPVAMGISVERAAATPVTVPLLIIDPPAGFELPRLTTALDTYVPGARVAITTRGAADSTTVCADAQAAAKAARSSIALVARWANDGLVLERFSLTNCAAEATPVTDAPGQAAFVYRVTALKVASLIRDVAEPTPPPAPPALAPPPERPAPPPVSDVRPIVGRDVAGPAPATVGVEVGASGVASTAAAARVTMATVGVWTTGAWAFGGSAMFGLAHAASTAGGDGAARVIAAAIGLRRTLARRSHWEVAAVVEVGLVWARASATRAAASMSVSETTWTPTVASGVRARVPVTAGLAVAAGPTVEFAPRAVRLTIGDAALYEADQVRLRWDVRAEIRF